ncbi:tetratricopeptide repeat protein [Deferribacter autotrophicus]|uniref:Tetratricopeptide repeat protein n=1 Tax=Deferribacter autotrophicus TaxID=500465 RepID=A0A5A8F8C7_9BACT|nr:tetratricopeptide repeat protein [Deferribacter autotrophicus]KAA0258393.1 tetratricopeptide repeat protein [Deferribacter autotrophicus]
MDEKIRNRYLKDIEYFSKKLEEQPDSKVFMPLAIAYLKLGKYDEAIDTCIKGLDKNPNYLAAKTVLAQAYLEKGMIAEAKALLIEVTTLNKDNYRANKLLGDIYRSEDNLDKALYYYRNALYIVPEDRDLKELVEELAENIEAVPRDIEEIPEKEKIEEVIKEVQEDIGEEVSAEVLQQEDIVKEVDEFIEKGLDEEVKLGAEDLKEDLIPERVIEPETILQQEELSTGILDEEEKVEEFKVEKVKNAALIEQLEGWLENIRKVKASRSV